MKSIDLEKIAESRRASYITSASVVVFLAVVSAAALNYWLAQDVTTLMAAEVPGTDSAPTGTDALQKVDLSGVLETFDGSPADLTGSWPSFRGEGFDNISRNTPPLAGSWSDDGPEILWSLEVGEGYAAPAVLDGVVYLMDYDEEYRQDVLRAFSLEDGQEIWRRSYRVMVLRNHGMSRTIPAVTEKYIVTMGPKCHVVCLDTATGDFRWGLDLQADYGTKEPLWYAAQCPVIDNDQAIIAPAGDEVLMMAVDCESGDVLWETPNAHGWKMSHSSIIPMTILGKKMYVYAAQGGVSGVSAEGDDAGELLWEMPWEAKVVAPSPVQVEDDRIFVTAGYNGGNMMLQLHEANGEFSVEVVYKYAPREGLSCEQQTPIYSDGLLYGIMPKSAGALKGQFVCYRPDGTLEWSSGSDKRFGFGPFLKADGKFFIMDDHGVLTMLDATTPKYAQLGQATVLGKDPWGPIALAGSRMFLRDMGRLICVELAAG